MKASVQKALEQIFKEQMDVNSIKDLIVHVLTKAVISHVNKAINHAIKAVISHVNKVVTNHVNKVVTNQDNKADTNKDQIMATKVTNNKVIVHTITKATTMEVTTNKADIKVMADINHAKDTTKVIDNKINVNALQDTIQMRNTVLKSALSIVKTI